MRNALVSVVLLAALPFAALTPAVAAENIPASTTIRFAFETGAPTGKIMAALYDSAEAYEGGAPVRAAEVDVAAGQTQAVFADLPAGNYALKAFHDVDGNGRMNTNPFGMPTEPFAFSNNARGNMGPASWERAEFAASGAVEQTVIIR